MEHEQPTAQPSVAEHPAPVRASQAPDSGAPAAPTDEYRGLLEPGETDWLAQAEELPQRPRRRLLTPSSVGLASVLIIACGFLAGVVLQKDAASESGESSGSSATLGGGFPFPGPLGGRRPRGGAAGAGAGAGAGGGAAGLPGGAGAFPGGGLPGAGGFPGALGSPGATTGTVSVVHRGTLYVTSSSGPLIRVSTTPSTALSKSQTSSLGAIRVGETVIVTGTAAPNGSISARSITIGQAAGSLGGGLAGLFGGSAPGGSPKARSGQPANGAPPGAAGAAGGPPSAGAGGGASGGGEPSLFGKG